MTSKRFSVKNLILACALLLLAMVMAFSASAGVVSADTRVNAKADVNSSYAVLVGLSNGEGYLVDENNYNAKTRLDTIKANADYALDNCEESLVESFKNQYLEEIAIINDFISVGESLKSYVDSKNAGDYGGENSQKWLNIQGYLNGFLDLLNVENLFNAGNLNRNYLNNTIGDENGGRYKTAKDNIDGIAPNQEIVTNIEQVRIDQIALMQTALNAYVASGYYDDNDARTTQFNTAKSQINASTSEGSINDIRSEFVTKLHASKTVVEKVYDYYIHCSTYPDTDNDGVADLTPESVTNLDLENAITVFQKVKTDMDNSNSFVDSSKFATIVKEGANILDVYTDRMVKRIKASYNWKHYSERNLNVITKIEAQAKQDMDLEGSTLGATDFVAEINNIVNTAIFDISQVLKNVSTITTCSGNVTDFRRSKYTVTVECLTNPYAFDPEAYVVARDYTFYAVKVNVNRMLKRLDVGEDLQLEVKYYIDIVIYDEIVRGNTDDERSRKYQAPKDENGNYIEKYKVSIEMNEAFMNNLGIDSSSTTNQVQDKVKVVYYYNGQMEGYSKTDNGYTLDQSSRNVGIQGGNVLVFETNHFSPYAVCGTSVKDMLLFKGPIFKNPFFYIAVVLVAIILTVLLIIIIKNCKYKLVFVNNGGTRVATRKFKCTEPIEMPTGSQNPTKKGFIFGGWFVDKACRVRFTQTIMRRRNIKVFAKWIPVEVSSIEDIYKALKACLLDYEKVGADVGFVAEDKVARIIISNDKVLLFLCGDAETYKAKGLNVEVDSYPENEGINNKITIQTTAELEIALECIEMAMLEKGLMEKDGDPVVEDISEEEKQNGYLYTITHEKVADSLKDYFELLRTISKSYVLMGDSGTPRDLDGKYIVKAKLVGDVINLYLPYEGEGATKVSDALYKDVPYLYTITDAETCANALNAITTSMEYIGMTKYPRNAKLLKNAGDEETAFGYKIKFN